MSKINAAMFGILTAAAASWDSYDNDTQRRLRNLRNDASDALDQIQNYISRGEQVRGRLPSVMDALLGLALANPTQTTPEILPTSTKLSRPIIDESSVADLSWPLKTGTYDAKGRVTELGDLSRTFLALTFQELRAFVEGAAQEKSPTQAGLTQINRAANQLISVLSTLNLTAAQYTSAWLKVFTGSSIATDLHLGVPIIGTPNGGNNVASVVYLANSTKTDRAMRIRVTASNGGNINVNNDIVTVTFASEWKDSSGLPITPAIVGSNGLFASASSSTGFTLQASVLIPSNSFADFSLIVSGG